MTNITNKTLRLNRTRAFLIKLGLERIQDEIKLNNPNEDYIELLKVISLCSKHLCMSNNNILYKNSRQSITDDSNRVSI